MKTRIAMISIIVESDQSIASLNSILHNYQNYIIGRMGIPYREAGVNLISIAIDAPINVINSMTGKIGNLPGISVKTAVSAVDGRKTQ